MPIILTVLSLIKKVAGEKRKKSFFFSWCSFLGVAAQMGGGVGGEDTINSFKTCSMEKGSKKEKRHH